MLLTLAQAAAGLLLLFFGGDWLIRGASTLALRLGVSPLVIGLTIVAFGTSAPELVVSLDAATSGADDISVGNVVGSNIANVALILAIAALLRPIAVEAKIVKVDVPIMIGVSVALLAVLYDGTASRVEGLLLVTALIAYAGFTFWKGKREAQPVQAEFATAAPKLESGILAGSLLAAIGLGLLVGGGHLLVLSAVELATVLGMSQATIGLTVVAIGTSLPEAATSVVAAMRGRGDIAVGNVVGSNIFNVLGILGVTAVVKPLEMGAITWIDLGTMFALAILVGAFIATKLCVDRREGAVLLACFVGYTTWLIAG